MLLQWKMLAVRTTCVFRTNPDVHEALFCCRSSRSEELSPPQSNIHFCLASWKSNLLTICDDHWSHVPSSAAMASLRISSDVAKISILLPASMHCGCEIDEDSSADLLEGSG